MKGKVTGYNKEQDYHDIIMEDGRKVKADLFVNGDLRDIATNESIIGKSVDIQYFTPYIEIAYGVSVLHDGVSANKERKDVCK